VLAETTPSVVIAITVRVPVVDTFPLQEHRKKAPETKINARKTGIVRFIIMNN
jgi:hypothetical protein